MLDVFAGVLLKNNKILLQTFLTMCIASLCVSCASDLCPSPWQVFSGGRVLSVDSAQVSDTGRYTCVAVNAGGEQHRDYDLKVYGKKITSCYFNVHLMSAPSRPPCFTNI